VGYKMLEEQEDKTKWWVAIILIIFMANSAVGALFYFDLQSDYFNLESQFNVLKSEKSNLESQISAINSQKSSLQSQVSNLLSEKSFLELQIAS
jgi:peptidoglycan hydrolase CwlO-like protein